MSAALNEYSRLQVEAGFLKHCEQNAKAARRMVEMRARIEYLTAPHWMTPIKKLDKVQHVTYNLYNSQQQDTNMHTIIETVEGETVPFYLNHSCLGSLSFGSEDMAWCTLDKEKADLMLDKVRTMHGTERKFSIGEV